MSNLKRNRKLTSPILGRWQREFDAKSLEDKIRFYENILAELQKDSPYPMHHVNNHPAATHWMRMLVLLRMEKLKRDYCE